ncbi:hypothetical protein MKW94_007151, partial [Papaver nudicaule]|nr:hypothetical protein [Papaver nudicaule]
GINDGRFFYGAFHCIDKQGNIILQDAVEYHSIEAPHHLLWSNGLGLILIPSSCRKSCHIDNNAIEGQLSQLSLEG